MDELKIDTITVTKKLTAFIKTEFAERSFRKAVLGLSGGVDSSLVATLAAKALGPRNVVGVHMPYVKSKDDFDDVSLLANKLGIVFEIVDIAPMVDIYFRSFPDADKVRRGNKMARERMSVLYDLSKKYDALVLGCGNRTEILVGYFTLHGDSACALNPVGSLYKTRVWQMARALGLPQSIIDKRPSAGLWAGQSDEGELGISYEELDRILYYLVDKKRTKAQLIKKGFSAESITKVLGLMKESEFKRRTPPIPAL